MVADVFVDVIGVDFTSFGATFAGTHVVDTFSIDDIDAPISYLLVLLRNALMIF